jgi:hypothetical protein
LELAAINAFEKSSAKHHSGGRVHLEKGGIEQIPHRDESGRGTFDNDNIPDPILSIFRSPSGAEYARTFVGARKASQDEMNGFSVLKSNFERLGSSHEPVHAIMLSKKWAKSLWFVKPLFIINYRRRRPRFGHLSETKWHT